MEIHDRAFTVEMDPTGQRMIPKTNTGMVQLLTLLNSLKSWGFKGTDDNGDLLTGDVPVLPINEENIKKLPSSHGNKLARIAGVLNGLGEPDTKN
jgi:hypothetical protein